MNKIFEPIMRVLFKRPSAEELAAETKEYDQIRSTIHLCIYSGSLLLIEMRINAFKSKTILPKELHVKMCDDLDRVFNQKYKEVIEMELQMDNTMMVVSN